MDGVDPAVARFVDTHLDSQDGMPVLTDASALAHAYRSNPMRIVRLVGASWSRAARDFADAFRFRRK